MIRIALRMLIGDRAKYLGLLGGFFFTALMITQMTSLFAGIMSRTFTVVTETTNVDIWVMDPAVESVNEPAPMPETNLQRVRSITGVKYAMPLYVGNLRARLPSGRFVNAEVVGVDAATMIGAPNSDGFDWSNLRLSDAVVVDRLSARNFLYDTFDANDPHGPTRPINVGDEITLNDRQSRVVGIADAGSRMFAKPVLYTTYDRAVTWAPRQAHLLTYIIVKANDGTDPETLARAIEHQTGLRARTKHQLDADTVWYTIAHTDIVKQVGFMVLLTSTVGVIVSGLLLSMFITDNLKYFASLKAMGLSDLRIVGMLYLQTLWCGVFGTAMGMGAACGVGAVMRQVNMPFLLLWPAAVAIPAVILTLCLIAATLSVRRVLALEPAMVFR
jgi:putative ABC transport system permease protein